jgi:hypothetical protein
VTSPEVDGLLFAREQVHEQCRQARAHEDVGDSAVARAEAPAPAPGGLVGLGVELERGIPRVDRRYVNAPAPRVLSGDRSLLARGRRSTASATVTGRSAITIMATNATLTRRISISPRGQGWKGGIKGTRDSRRASRCPP